MKATAVIFRDAIQVPGSKAHAEMGIYPGSKHPGITLEYEPGKGVFIVDRQILAFVPDAMIKSVILDAAEFKAKS